MKNDVIERKEILENVLKWKDEDLVKVITGVRRSGKSTVLRMIESSLKVSGVSNDCIAYIDFECREYLSLTTKEQVWEELDRQLTGSGKKYVLLDEVQRVRDFELLVDALYADKQYDCYLTGSNAWMLSGELATYLSGRYVAIHVTPLSFSEYVNGLDMHPLDAFVEYSNFGSFPFVRKMVEIGRQNDVGQYLEGIFNTVLLKDVALRTKMSDAETLQRISAYLFDNIGNLTNTKRISDGLTSAGGKVSYPSVVTYLKNLCDAFLFYKCERVDVKGLALLKTGAKYYAVDTGLRYWMNGNRAGDNGRVLENIVYLELMRNHRNVFTVVTRNGYEVDFVTRDGDDIRYYQVAESVKSPETLERELRPFKEIRDNYPKFLITGDYGKPIMHEGIRQISVYDFLTMQRN